MTRKLTGWALLNVIAYIAACAPTSTTMADPTTANPTVESIPIAGELGLADLRVILPENARDAIVLVTEPKQVVVRLLPDKNNPSLFTGRFYSGASASNNNAPIKAQLIYTAANGTEHISAFPIDTAPDLPPARAHASPDWAKGAVWYQIFPERFRNAQPLNDQHDDYTTHLPWGSDWWIVHNAEIEAQWRRCGAQPSVYGLDPEGVIWTQIVWNRRYGGDLQGIIEKLDHIQSLGVTALYLNPVFHASSMHKYDATDFRHIDPSFGHPGDPYADGTAVDPVVRTGVDETDPQQWGWTPADRYFIDEFLPAVHARGMKVIIDGVFNHSGRRHWAFQHVLEHGTDSPYSDWFYFKFREDGTVKNWIAWDGPSGWLPKFKQTKNGDLVAPVKRQIMNVTRRWMDPNGDGDPSDGVDGWRLDVPLDVGRPFWTDWYALVKEINPESYVAAEIWGDADDWIGGETFDVQMNYPFSSAVAEFLSIKRDTTNARDLSARLEHVFSHEPQLDMVQQNLMCSHDTDRLASMMFNQGPREYDGNNRIEAVAAGTYSPHKPDPIAFKRSLIAVALQAVCPGAPMIYYGDELGMHGPDDPSCRKPCPWPDLGSPENPDDAHDPKILAAYQAWFNLRAHETVGPVLRYGGFETIDSGHDRVAVLVRRLNAQAVWLIVNDSDEPFDTRGVLPEGEPEHLAGELRGRFVPKHGASAWMQ